MNKFCKWIKLPNSFFCMEPEKLINQLEFYMINRRMTGNIGLKENIPWIYYLVLLFTPREKSPNRELFWSAFSCIRIGISPYSVQMQENSNQNNSKYGQFLRSFID